MVVLGGYDCIGNYTTNPVIHKTLVGLNHAMVYNTWTQLWSNQTLRGHAPGPRTYHTAVTSKFLFIVFDCILILCVQPKMIR